jgi:hypothetical protein
LLNLIGHGCNGGDVGDLECGTGNGAAGFDLPRNVIYERARFGFRGVACDLGGVDIVAVVEFFLFAGFFVLARAATVDSGVSARNVVADGVLEITAVFLWIGAVFELVKNISGLPAF